jgi:hypothetical protein
VLNGESTTTNVIVFDFTRPGIEHTIYGTGGEHLVYSFDNNNIESPSVTPAASPISNHIGGVMVSVLASSAVDRGFDPRSGQTKDYKIGNCCFSAKHARIRRKSRQVGFVD